MDLKPKKTILLTGAGFSANFGGLLAKEIWSKILNNPKTDTLPDLKAEIRKNFDFESLYAEMKGQNKEVLLDIIVDSFTSMDDALKSYGANSFSQFDINLHGVTKFLGLFAGTATEPGFHFTLNQDLLLERLMHTPALGLPAYHYRDYRDKVTSGQLNARDHILLPDDAFLSDFETNHFSSAGDFHYVKLHGSLGWLAHDGNKQMIMGMNKLEDINRVPLLKWYFELFQQTISQDGVNLFIFGYSFRDKHVNDCLVKAIDEHKLKIYLITPEDPGYLLERLKGNPHPGQSVSYMESDSGKKIWNAIEGYYPYRLNEIYPGDEYQSVTHIASDLENAVRG